ncbi:Small subunit (SSU) processome component [Malassezia pachydermatis]|uniref:Nuc189-domain-containing protein n=1 Tax=Malassezia pachydermatis TaxID=77020 RepID=A0A0M8MT59_9BASI|nr:nuc189-domain-containing protein [Malassezia pachydermatis]KOS13834.1 nuc189-domain-containing protein [Malassezia pachydermatis]
MAKNKGNKAPKSRPVSTSSLSQPVHGSTNDNVTAFSRDASYFAQLSQAVDRVRLRVYAPQTAGVVADYLLPESLGCRTMAWVLLSAPRDKSDSASSKKRKAHGKAETKSDAASAAPSWHVALGMSDGTVLLYSPTTARVIAMLVASTPDSTSAAVVSLSSDIQHLWGATANGWVHGWDLSKMSLSSSRERMPPTTHFLPDSKTPTTMVTCGPAGRLLTAHHAATVYALDTDRPSPVTHFSGHATPITHLAWAGEHGFVSAAAEDRHLYYWALPSDTSSTSVGQARAMLTLDAPARRLLTWQEPKAGWHLLVVSELGTAQVYRLPQDVSKTQKGLAPLPVVARVHMSTPVSDMADAERTEDGERLRIARIIKSVKVVLDDALLHEDGVLRSTIDVNTSTAATPSAAASNETQRYKEGALSAGSRAELPQHAAATAALLGTEGGRLPEEQDGMADPHDDLLQQGDVVDEPTLAQRLKALKVQRGERQTAGDADEADDGDDDMAVAPVGGASLASSLTQALHSGDHSLLTSCLVHSDPTLIRTTVRRISGPLAVRLLEACVDRLNRGGVKSKGALGSARARGIVEWIHQTLTYHTAYLMSLPNLVTRLSQLHHSLATRLASYERLLALKGRMELVMSQIDMHMSYTADEAQMQVQGQKVGPRSTASELEQKQAAMSQRQQGETWVEADEDDVEDIGLSAGDDMAADDDVEALDDDDDDVGEMDEDDLEDDDDDDDDVEDEAPLDDDDSDVSVDDSELDDDDDDDDDDDSDDDSDDDMDE